MVNTVSRIITVGQGQPVPPPGIVIPGKGIPIINGKLPVLTKGAEHVRRCSCRQIPPEIFRVCPYIAGILVHQDGKITLQYYIPFGKDSRGLQELLVQFTLQPDPVQVLLFELGRIPQGFDPRFIDTGMAFPFLPMCTTMDFFQSPVDCVFDNPRIRTNPGTQRTAWLGLLQNGRRGFFVYPA